MSGKATGWVWDHARGLDPTAKLVLLAVADAADQHGEGSRQTKATIAEMVEVSQRTVQRALAGLVDAGLLEVQERAFRNRPTVYRLPMKPRGDTHVSPDMTPDPGDNPEDSVDNPSIGETPMSPLVIHRGDKRGDTLSAPACRGTVYRTGERYNPPTPPGGKGDGDAVLKVVHAEDARELVTAFLAGPGPRPAVRTEVLMDRCAWQMVKGYTAGEVAEALAECHSFTVTAIDGRCRAVRARRGTVRAQELHPAGRGRETGAQVPLLALREDRPPCVTCHGAGIVLGEDLLARKCEECGP